jgi:hypothetical protein
MGYDSKLLPKSPYLDQTIQLYMVTILPNHPLCFHALPTYRNTMQNYHGFVRGRSVLPPTPLLNSTSAPYTILAPYWYFTYFI